MCSFLITNFQSLELESANWYQQFRGPDLTTVSKIEDVTFVHNLLTITGATRPQPFVESGVACVYNGEIYNFADFGEFSSDGECIVPLYQERGTDFAQELDGEFAVAIVDFKNGRIVLASDTFATKPLHYAVENGNFAISSYGSALKSLGFVAPRKLTPNTSVVLSLTDLSVKSTTAVWTFSTAQYKSNFDNWISAFENAIRKRVSGVREKVFIGLSSGYDSGAIACELARQGVPFATYSIVGNEDEAVIRERIEAISPLATSELIQLEERELEATKALLKEHIEDVYYDIYSSTSDYLCRSKMQDDNAATGLGMIFSRAQAAGRKIYLSGQGADEITSDYGFAGTKLYPHSNFGGLFPIDLGKIFPWASFYGSTQASYLLKEEYVAGAFGIEARYPFLDKQVVQEFLSLDSKLKNSAYKAPLRHYMDKFGFPCAFDRKHGFSWGPDNEPVTVPGSGNV